MNNFQNIIIQNVKFPGCPCVNLSLIITNKWQNKYDMKNFYYGKYNEINIQQKYDFHENEQKNHSKLSQCTQNTFQLSKIDDFQPFHLADIMQDKMSAYNAQLWHLVQFNEFDRKKHFLDCNSNRDVSKLFPQMTIDGKMKLCENKKDFSSDFNNYVDCSGILSEPVFSDPNAWNSNPYCLKETSPVGIVSLDCAYVESGFTNTEVFWNILSFGSSIAAFQYNDKNYKFNIPKNTEIIEFEELACAGTSVYPGAAGHFFNEIFPRLLHMNDVLPEHIPLLWPDNELAKNVLYAFQEKNLVSSSRKYVWSTAGQVLKAKRLFVLTSEYKADHNPLCLFINQKLFQRKIQYFVASNPSKEFQHTDILILSRGHSKARSIANENELVQSLKSYFPQKKLDIFEPLVSMNFLHMITRIHSAKIIIGPHGANLNNMVGAKEGTNIIEIGYIGGMPADYFCLSRNLGFIYWLSLCSTGNYGSQLTANINDIIEIISLITKS